MAPGRTLYFLGDDEDENEAEDNLIPVTEQTPLPCRYIALEED